jgi:hypothetical protein
LAEERLIRVQGARTSAATGKELKVQKRGADAFRLRGAATGKELKADEESSLPPFQVGTDVEQQLGKN